MRVAPLLLLLPLAGASHAQDNCTINLQGSDAMQFDKQTVTVSSSCEEITVTLQHVGKLPVESMGHNVVISPTAFYQGAAQDGMQAGLDNDYVQPDDERVIAHTKMIGGGETASTTFPASKLEAGTPYTFFCSFPGHWAIMKGDLVVE